jgi:hypothetical protein
MKLKELQTMWAEDAKIDQTNLGRAAARVPELHAKYINLLSNYRLQFRKAETELLQFRQLKTRYFQGELSKEELQAHGWTPYLFRRPLKNELEDLLNGSEDVVERADRVEYLRTIMMFLESVLKSINSRTWDIKSAIEWVKFTNGEF